MNRRIFGAISAISLLVSLLMVAVWIRSLRHLDDVSLASSRQYLDVTSVEGSLCIRRLRCDHDYWNRRTTYASGHLSQLKYNLGNFEWRVLGFGYSSHPVPGGAGVLLPAKVVLIPHWFAIAAGCVMPGFWLHGYRRRSIAAYRKTHGLCPRCGYDLRASAERCPECGDDLQRLIHQVVSCVREMWRVLVARIPSQATGLNGTRESDSQLHRHVGSIRPSTIPSYVNGCVRSAWM